MKKLILVKKPLVFITLIAAVVSASAFDPLPSSKRACDSFERTEGLSAGNWEEGVVTKVAAVTLEASGGAKVLGAAIGTTVAVSATNDPSYVVKSLVGMIGGAIGSKVAESTASDKGYEVFVRTSAGRVLVVAQETTCPLTKGDTVYVSQTQGKTRVIRVD